MPVSGYLRISDADLSEIRKAVKVGDISKEEGAERERKGVLKQRDDVTSLAVRHGYQPSDVIWYEDNNLSAFTRETRRKGFERLLRDLAKGLTDGILFYDIDRFTRQPRDLERTIDVYELAKGPMIFDGLSGQNFDLSTADGRFSARLFVSIANKASEDTRRRILRETKRMAQKGEFHGGKPAFGWNPKNRLELDPVAADVIRRGTNWFTRGDRIGTILDKFYEEGLINPSTNRPFSRQHFRRILMRERNAGILRFRGEPMKDPDGNYIMGDWPQIVTVEEWEALMAKIRSRRTKTAPDTTTKYLLSGIARCGRCGARLHAHPVWQRGVRTKWYAYNCIRRRADECGAMQVVGPPVEHMIRELVWAVTDKALSEAKVQEDVKWTRQAELDDVELQVKELKDMWNRKEIRASIYVSALEDLESTRSELKGDRALHNAQASIPVTGGSIREGWSGLSLERQRDVIRTVLSAVLVHPAKSRGGKFDPNRIEPVFVQ